MDDHNNAAVLTIMIVIAASGLAYLWQNPALELPRYIADVVITSICRA